MWPGTGRDADRRSPQASAGTPNNTREPARSDKKKPQPRTVGVSLLVVVGLLPNDSLLGLMGTAAGVCGRFEVKNVTSQFHHDSN